METAVVDLIQNFGFPIACVIALGLWVKSYMNRVMDENKEREQCYQDLLKTYGEKMGEIVAALAEIKNDLCDLKTKE